MTVDCPPGFSVRCSPAHSAVILTLHRLGNQNTFRNRSMNHTRFLFSLVLLLVFSVQVHAAERPNVVIVMTDDQGYPEVSAHGNPVLQTPNLDALHSQSLRLIDFHVAPMCAPTRGQLLTRHLKE